MPESHFTVRSADGTVKTAIHRFRDEDGFVETIDEPVN
jgi:hypothetical protein